MPVASGLVLLPDGGVARLFPTSGYAPRWCLAVSKTPAPSVVRFIFARRLRSFH